MLIIPAVDIKDGKCVRLIRGEPKNLTIYYNNPLDAVKRWVDAGAKLIHIVDLDGALTGKMLNLKIIENIKKKFSIDLEVGGGIRNQEIIENLLSIGINRIIIGSLILDNITYAEEIFSKYKGKIILAMDFKGEYLATSGWQKVSKLNIKDTAKLIEKFQIREIIWTDIERDGTLMGMNFDKIKNVISSFKQDIIISGGIDNIDTIKKIRELNLDRIKGVIVGKALYENRIKIDELF